VVSDDEAVAAIRSPDFDPAVEAVLPSEPPRALGGGVPRGEVVWEERGLNRQRLRVSTDRESLLVVADNWFPAWEARIDGEPVPLLRAYHTLRAVPLPPGEHEVEIAYRSEALRGSFALSLASILLLAGVAVVDTLRRRGSSTPGG
jgi:hypothetical protein